MLSGGQLVKVVLRLICLAGVWRKWTQKKRYSSFYEYRRLPKEPP
ncbi:unknown [Bacteroides sp. CAG:702]|nr:unknown [Bacteroides sp. CAG:702]